MREAPLHAGHIKNMLAVTEMGGIIHPPVPAFYQKSPTIADLVDHALFRALDCFGIEMQGAQRWGERAEVDTESDGDRPAEIVG